MPGRHRPLLAQVAGGSLPRTVHHGGRCPVVCHSARSPNLQRRVRSPLPAMGALCDGAGRTCRGIAGGVQRQLGCRPQDRTSVRGTSVGQLRSLALGKRAAHTRPIPCSIPPTPGISESDPCLSRTLWLQSGPSLSTISRSEARSVPSASSGRIIGTPWPVICKDSNWPELRWSHSHILMRSRVRPTEAARLRSICFGRRFRGP